MDPEYAKLAADLEARYKALADGHAATDAAYAKLQKDHAELQAAYSGIEGQVRTVQTEMQAQIDAANAASSKSLFQYNDLLNEHRKSLMEIESLRHQLEPFLPKPKPPYVWKPGDTQCPNVPRIKGATCPRCGWMFGGTRIQDLEPHPVMIDDRSQS